jgi:hypothetical protein
MWRQISHRLAIPHSESEAARPEVRTRTRVHDSQGLACSYSAHAVSGGQHRRG